MAPATITICNIIYQITTPTTIKHKALHFILDYN